VSDIAHAADVRLRAPGSRCRVSPLVYPHSKLHAPSTLHPPPHSCATSPQLMQSDCKPLHTHTHMQSCVSSALSAPAKQHYGRHDAARPLRMSSAFTFWPARVHRADTIQRAFRGGCSHVLGEVPREILALGAVYASEVVGGAPRLRELSNVACMTALFAHHALELAGHALHTLATCTIVRPSPPAVTLRALTPCIAAGNCPDALDMRTTRGRQARFKGSTVGARGTLLATAVGPRHGRCGRTRERRAHCARLIPRLDLVGAGAARRTLLPSIPWEYVRVESTHAWEV